MGCESLTSMPDLSGLAQLNNVILPEQLEPWEACGRKALNVLTGEGVPRDIANLWMVQSITSLPSWVVAGEGLGRSRGTGRGRIGKE